MTMSVRSLVMLALMIGLAPWVMRATTAQDRPATVPTFNQAIAPILFSRCVGCHRPGEAAPMSLLSYENARPWARAIKARVLAREMPPWPADPRYGDFANQHTLTDAEIDTLVAWSDGGAPEGSGSAPAPPAFLDGWTAQMDRPPDLIVNGPEFDLPSSGIIPEFKVWSPRTFGKDRTVEAIELRPLNRAVMHHASVFRTKLPNGTKIGSAALWPGGPVLEGVPVLRNGSPAPDTLLPSFGAPLIFYVPAGGFLQFPKGVAKRIRGDEYLQWTFHFVTTGKPEKAGARLGIWFSRGNPKEVVTTTVTDRVQVNGQDVPKDARGPQFPNIAPREANYTVTGVMRLTEPVTLYALWPHMHYRGRDITFSVIDTKGQETVLLAVPRYRFEWQFTYVLRTPLKIPQGSTIRVVAHYDNSALNRANPDPAAEVIWGPQANNEMFDPFVELTFDRRSGISACENQPATIRSDSGGPGFLTPCQQP